MAARITPEGRGAIAVVAIRGPSAHRAVLECFVPATPIPGPRMEVDRVRYGRWRGGESVVAVAVAEDAVEVHCHGGRAAVAAILDDLARCGVGAVDWPELLRRQGVDEETVAMQRLVTGANTTRTAAIALDQYRGALRQWARTFVESLRSLSADSPLPEPLRAELREVLQREALGRHLVDPWRVVVAGPPNVGKSSLMNAMLGYQRAITYDLPGTTRDVIHADTAVEGWPVRLSDTAGLRRTDDELEAEGVRRAVGAVASADLVLLVADASLGPSETHQEILAPARGPVILVWNKCDLVRQPPTRPRWLAERHLECRVSAVTGEGIENLVGHVALALVPRPPDAGDPVPVTSGQRTVLRQAERAPSVDHCRQVIGRLATEAAPIGRGPTALPAYRSPTFEQT